MKTTSILQLNSKGLDFYKDHIKRLAMAEGFPSHAMSAYDRIPIEKSENESDPGIAINYLNDNVITITRTTRESVITVSISKGERDIEGKKKINTGLNFLNHMIETIAWRSNFNISINISLEGAYKLMHVVAEDAGITFGAAISKLIQREFTNGIEGSGYAYGIIDEAESSVAISFEGRSLFKTSYRIPMDFELVEDMKSRDLENFLGGFAQGAKCTIHATVYDGTDPHHIWESLFRAFGEALRKCFEENKFRKGTTPGVKGI
jgi:imidazoleglycerol-phosphate dehydratase